MSALKPVQAVRTDLDIHLTGLSDLLNVQRLWADPGVMVSVGFPEGLHETLENLESNWLPWVQQPPKRQHWSVYEHGRYCGETFYEVDETGLAAMDIKLLPEARGQGIASAALSFALDAAFHAGGAKRAYVDPDIRNEKALALYDRLGFRSAPWPQQVEATEGHVYLEISAPHTTKE